MTPSYIILDIHIIIVIFIVMDNGNEELALVKIENPGRELESKLHACMLVQIITLPLRYS